MIYIMLQLIIPILLMVVVPTVYIRRALKRNMAGFDQACRGQDTAEEINTEGLIEMAKDEVCGKFISTENAIKYIGKTNVHYFCSEACREKFVE